MPESSNRRQIRAVGRDMAIELSQAVVDEQVMPKLRRDDRDKAQLDRRFLRSFELAVADLVAPELHRRSVEVTGLSQGFFAEQLIDERRDLVIEKNVDR